MPETAATTKAADAPPAGGESTASEQSATSKGAESKGKGDAAASAAPGAHPLHTPWTMWFTKKQKKRRGSGAEGRARGDSTGRARSDSSNDMVWQENLKKLGTFDTVEDFWNVFTHLKKPREFRESVSYHLFRNEKRPMWESWPEGGCWFIKMPHGQASLDKQWERLVFACVGEMFGELDVIGVALTIRSKEDVLAVWNASNNTAVRMRIGDKVKRILALEPNTVVEYKLNRVSMKDKSTYSNARQYIVPAEEGGAAPTAGAGTPPRSPVLPAHAPATAPPPAVQA